MLDLSAYDYMKTTEVTGNLKFDVSEQPKQNYLNELKNEQEIILDDKHI
jgi:hypothetical protein